MRHSPVLLLLALAASPACKREPCATPVYADADGDGFGVDDNTRQVCPDELPEGWVLAGGDCSDDDPDIHPGADERCDGLDNNCDAQVDEVGAIDGTTYYADADGDGFGDPDTRFLSCALPANAVENDLDCDDDPGTGAAVNPDAVEVCDDGVDNDCDTVIDGCVGYRSWNGAHPDVRLIGTSTGRLGEVVDVGDVDGDGLDDVLVGAPWASVTQPNEGGAYLIYGAPLEKDDAPLELQEADVPRWGPQESGDTWFADTVAVAGDLDGDGFEDIAIGAPRHGTARVGMVVLVPGGATRLDATARDVEDLPYLLGPAGSRFGSALGTLGDFTGDGLDDLLIGASSEDIDGAQLVGSVWLLPGRPEPYTGAIALDGLASLHGEAEGTVLGWARAMGGGDVNGDGNQDMVMSAAGDLSEGEVYVVHGSSTPLSGSHPIGDVADSKVYGTRRRQWVASTLARPIGDLDQDGYVDIAINETFYRTGAGEVGGQHILFGGADGVGTGTIEDLASITLAGAQHDDSFGNRAPVIADFDDDGVNELVVGNAGSDDHESERSAVFVFDPGEDGSTWRDLEGSVLVTEDDAVHILRGPSCPKTCRFSTGLGSGDFNGDGLEDLVVGAGLANGYSGEVMVYLTEPLR